MNLILAIIAAAALSVAATLLLDLNMAATVVMSMLIGLLCGTISGRNA